MVEPTHLKKCSSNWIISPNRAEIKKYLKPHPRIICTYIKYCFQKFGKLTHHLQRLVGVVHPIYLRRVFLSHHPRWWLSPRLGPFLHRFGPKICQPGSGGVQGEGVFLGNLKDSVWEDCGTLGMIRGITTPPFRILLWWLNQPI